MVYLHNITNFPEKSEWAYLYAVADIYQNYSIPAKEKGNLLNPHSLKDGDVIEILSKNYNLTKVHRNTIANIREKLVEYFGFVFGTYKKGKYLIEGSIKEDDITNISLIAELIICSPFIPYETAIKVLTTLSNVIAFPDLKKEIQLEMSRDKKKREYELKKKLIENAILAGDYITFYYRDQKMIHKKPIKTNTIKKKLVLNCEPIVDGFYKSNETYYVDQMEYIKIEVNDEADF